MSVFFENGVNVRFDLIHRPLSDLFIVYNEPRVTDQPTPSTRAAG
jgi:hypothetical protein